MDAQQILDELTKQEESLRADLLDMEKNFNIKKEQYIKLQGAIEALNLVDKEEEEKEDDSED
jgi:hypothetical protein